MNSDFNYPVKISVLIPAYNGAPYIAEAIESVLAQTFADFELIIADDGSTDGTQDIARNYAARDHRIVFHQNDRNLGCGKNNNQLVLMSRGEYLKLLCQDDVFAAECLEVFANVLDTHPRVSLVTSFQQFIGDRSEVRKLPTLPAICELEGRIVQRHVLRYGNWIGGETAVMMRRKALACGLFNPDWVWQVDQDMWLKALADSNLYVVPKILTFPRIHGQQGTVTFDKDFAFIREELMQRKIAFLFPNIYGVYTKQEQRALYEPHFMRLIQNTLIANDPGARAAMMEIGQTIAPVQFRMLLARTKLNGLVDRTLQRWNLQHWTRYGPLFFAKTMRDRAWKKKFGYQPAPAVADLGYGTIGTHGAIRIPLDMLRSPIMSPTGFKVVAVGETPHYRWIRDLVAGGDDSVSRKGYRQYLELYHLEDDIEASLAKVVDLVASIRAESAGGRELTVVTHPPSHFRDQLCAIIFDGNHRASIAKALGHRHINCRLIEIEMTPDYYPPNLFEREADAVASA